MIAGNAYYYGASQEFRRVPGQRGRGPSVPEGIVYEVTPYE